MPPMRKPAPASDDPWRHTLSIDTYARRHQLTVGEVRQLLGSGQLPFVQIRGQIRVASQRISSQRISEPGIVERSEPRRGD
jgi:hypothetical protein